MTAVILFKTHKQKKANVTCQAKRDKKQYLCFEVGQHSKRNHRTQTKQHHKETSE